MCASNSPFSICKEYYWINFSRRRKGHKDREEEKRFKILICKFIELSRRIDSEQQPLIFLCVLCVLRAFVRKIQDNYLNNSIRKQA
jgi:hypothetical protein